MIGEGEELPVQVPSPAKSRGKPLAAHEAAAGAKGLTDNKETRSGDRRPRCNQDSSETETEQRKKHETGANTTWDWRRKSQQPGN